MVLSKFRLNFGLIAVTMFISMWVSNAAVISTMVPIIKAVLEALENVRSVSILRWYYRILLKIAKKNM